MKRLLRAGFLAIVLSCLTIRDADATKYDSVDIRSSSITLLSLRASNEQLPSCLQTCVDEQLPQYSCHIGDPCYCEDSKVSEALDICMGASCQLPFYLAGQRSYADTCNKPVRNKGPATRRLNWAMFVVATIFIFGRFLGRMKSLGGSGFGWDDWVALLAYAMVVPTDVTSELEVQNGLGMDMYVLTLDNVVLLMKCFFFGEVLYSAIIILTKISLVLLYLRIWPADSVTRAFRLGCWALVSALTAFLIAGTVALALQCTPISHVWNQVLGAEGSCINLKALVYAHGALNVTFDIVVILLPVHVLLGMKFPNTKKAGLCAVFLVGFLVTICSLIRLQYVDLVNKSKNITWDLHPIGVWSLIEANFSVVVCCMPALAGLLQRTWKKVFGTPPQMGYSMVSGDEAFSERSQRTQRSSQPSSDPEMALEQWEQDARRNVEAASKDSAVSQTP